jgi:hypothetical protein
MEECEMPDVKESPDTSWIAAAGLNDLRVLSIKQWRELNGFSEATADRILKSGKGPKVVQLSERRRGIRVIDNRRWQEESAR